MSVASKYTSQAVVEGETAYSYRVKETKKTSGCPKCGGAISRDPIFYCVNCGWEGPTREGETSTEATMAGGKGGKIGRFEWMWKAENDPHYSGFKRTRTDDTRELQARVYEMREMGTMNKVVAKIIGRSESYTKDLYAQYKTEVLGE